MANTPYYIGVMSGTSADGADLVLVSFEDDKPLADKCDIKATLHQPYPDALRQKVLGLYQPGNNEIDRLGSLAAELAHFYAQAIKSLLANANISADQVAAVGNHGQTIRHRPDVSDQISHPFTLQIGCQQTLALLTGIKVIADFRTKDIALGGQGAPLVPAFHQYLFSPVEQDTFIVNLGGIANITYLTTDESKILGYDTGPANALMDAWCEQHTGNPYDKDGQWAASGQVHHSLLERLLQDEYFAKPAPKSTGREYFNLAWLKQHLDNLGNPNIAPEDIQATLLQLTAVTIADQIQKIVKVNAKPSVNSSPKSFVYLCGGGIENITCYKKIKQLLSEHEVNSIHSLKVNNQAFEATAFAWFAYAYDKKIYNHIPEATGASAKTILGIAYYP